MKKTKALRPKATIIGVCWYAPQDWARVKSTSVDSELFENTFSEWEAMAADGFATVRTAYPNAVKVYIQADEFFVWCHLHARPNNSDARAGFVAEKIQRAADAKRR